VMAVINEWRHYWRTQARQERRMEKSRESGGVEGVRDKGANHFAHQTLRWPATHTHTSRLPGRPTKLSTVNSAINIVQHERKGTTPQKWPKKGRAFTHFRRNSQMFVDACSSPKTETSGSAASPASCFAI
jgi:hypothetical protein